MLAAMDGVTAAVPAEPRRKDPSIGFAHAAIASMLRLGIRPTPEHYCVWYRVHSDGESALRKAVDQRLEQSPRLADDDMRALYEAFCGNASEAASLSDLSDRLGHTLRDAAGIMTGAVDDATRYGASLQTFSETIGQAAGRVPPLLRNLLTETQELRERGTAMARELSETAGKVDALRQELDEARRDATTDPLTGLGNRRAFDAAAAALLEPGAQPLALLTLDLDRFKSVNDRFGHAAGDAVLCQTAAILRAATRANDIAARLGGEEFALLLPRTPPAAARDLAERLRAAIGRAAFKTGRGEETLRVTVSIGLAQRRPEEAIVQLLTRADTALYAAKSAGRDQVRGADDPPGRGQDWR